MQKELMKIINELSMVERNSLFEEAIKIRNKNFIKMAILFGADVTINDNFAIIEMSEMGDIELVRLLIESGADPAANDNEVIRYPSEDGYAEIVKILIEAGADPTANDNEAIKQAFRYENIEVIKVFIEAGVKIDDEILSTVISEEQLKILKLVFKKNYNQ